MKCGIVVNEHMVALHGKDRMHPEIEDDKDEQCDRMLWVSECQDFISGDTVPPLDYHV